MLSQPEQANIICIAVMRHICMRITFAMILLQRDFLRCCIAYDYCKNIFYEFTFSYVT